MKFHEYVTRLGNSAPHADLTNLKTELNIRLERLASMRKWRYYMAEHWFAVEPNVRLEEGLSVDKGSQTVTLDPMPEKGNAPVGWMLRVDKHAGDFRVTDAVFDGDYIQSLTLDRPWPHDDISDGAYTIWLDRYPVPSDLCSVVMLRDEERRRLLRELSGAAYHGLFALRPSPDALSAYQLTGGEEKKLMLAPNPPSRHTWFRMVYMRRPEKVDGPGDEIDAPYYLEDALYLALEAVFLRRSGLTEETMARVKLTDQDYQRALSAAHRADAQETQPFFRNWRNLI